jgi:hypothetical protein
MINFFRVFLKAIVLSYSCNKCGGSLLNILTEEQQTPFGLKIVLLSVNEVNFIVSYLCYEHKH